MQHINKISYTVLLFILFLFIALFYSFYSLHRHLFKTHCFLQIFRILQMSWTPQKLSYQT